VSRKALLNRKGRRVAALGAAGLGACAVLAACSPVQVGAAAVVGNQRITQSSLDTQVANWQTAAKPYGKSVTLTSAQAPQAVLSWLVRFAVMEQVATTNGLTVTKAQTAAGLNSLGSVASQDGYSSLSELLVANGVAPQMFTQLGRWEAQEEAFAEKNNGGKAPTTTAEQTAFEKAIGTAQCKAAQTLDIKISPQYGRFDYATSSFSVVSASDTLSKPEPSGSASPSPASTEGLTPAAC
jgi:peptidyl-prolyl cis-trans isomerase SurA